MKLSQWLQSVGPRMLGRTPPAEPEKAQEGTPSGASTAGADELAANQVQFPFPRWALNGMTARAWILDHIPQGGIGAEVGVYRGHFSEFILRKLLPRKFYMVDPWTKWGEFFPWSDDYTCYGKLPTALARREAELRAANFPATETVIIEGMFPDCRGQIKEPLDWIYIDASHRYKETLVELNAAARILKPSGLIFGDDYYPDRTHKHHGVFRAVNEFIKLAPYEFVAGGPASQWCLRRCEVASVAAKGERSIKDKLAAGQLQYPFPKRVFAEINAQKSVLAFASPRSVGIEVGAFRGHFSDILLRELTPKKLIMIDAWTKSGQFFAYFGDKSVKRKIPTKVARDEARLRAEKYPNTETVVVDDEFRNWCAGVEADRADWIFLHYGHNYRQTLLRLVLAAGLLRPRGVIMGDGYFPNGSTFQHDVFRAITEFIGATPYELVSVGDSGQWCLSRANTRV